MSTKRKQSLYFPAAMLSEIRAEADRQDRSLSWLIQRAWKIARSRLQAIPSPTEISEEGDSDDPRGQSDENPS